MGYLSIPQAAERLKISRSQCFRLAQDGRLPSIKIGRNMVIDENVLTMFSTIKRVPGPKKIDGKPNEIKGEKNN